ncbi:MAG: SCO family protein [Ignavibacterium album]|uniref:SCO family protein n=1 Tax=Ignavibacterium album TaxID=591197 RepID=A0A7V3E6U6_9BACT|nr:SCO family protein [Ignavibacterium album]MCX8105846.1 SCO family protein [Ignavibacterium album]
MKPGLIKYFLLIIFLNLLVVTGCYKHFPLNQDISRTQNRFLNQDSVEVQFPELTKNKITLMAMIYTHCPDICPMTTHNMQLIESKLSKDELENVRFVVITFDPNRDTPDVLKKFAEIRDIDFSRWSLLSGDEQNTKEAMLKFDIKAVPADSSYDAEGNLSYYIVHTDRLSLIDQNGLLRKNYVGSIVDVNEVVNDIKYLLN